MFDFIALNRKHFSEFCLALRIFPTYIGYFKYRNLMTTEVKLYDLQVKNKLDFKKPINFLIHGFMSTIGNFFGHSI